VTDMWVFDHTAMVALFDAVPTPFGLWEKADRGDARLVFPAAAVAAASYFICANDDAWRALLYAPGVQITDLDQTAAIGSSNVPGLLAARHVMYEAQLTGGVIVTRAPHQYPDKGALMRVV
jgi:hypothetical protein